MFNIWHIRAKTPNVHDMTHVLERHLRLMCRMQPRNAQPEHAQKPEAQTGQLSTTH